MSEHGNAASCGGLSGFSIEVEPPGQTVKISPVGELDIAAVGLLQQELEELIGAGFARIAIDLRQVEFIDSAGLHALASAHTRAKLEGWQLAIIPGRRSVQRIFELTGVADRLPFALDTGGRSDSALSQLRTPWAAPR